MVYQCIRHFILEPSLPTPRMMERDVYGKATGLHALVRVYTKGLGVLNGCFPHASAVLH